MTRAGSLTLAGVAATLVALTGCADPARVPSGAARVDVLRSLGAPTSIYSMGPIERLQYSRAPAGTTVTNVDVDAASGKVVAVTQVLDEARFAPDIQSGTWREADVLRTYGRPEEITRVTSFDGTVWSWRYRQINNPRLLYVYLDRQGVVQRWHTGDDLRYFNTPNGAGRE